METLPLPPNNTRIGFYYFPDTVHYRDQDLKIWIPELHALDATWLTVLTPSNRAIPESFIKNLIADGIFPVLHIPASLETPPSLNELNLLFNVYANWGVNYIALFDKPNLRSNWPATAWAKGNLVERFLDIYLPYAEAILSSGIIPIFPALQPGGDYWDTAFLYSALHSIERRGYSRLLDRMVLGAYAWIGDKPLNWGLGGPEKWPNTRPYHTPTGSQDQCGFRIFDWYQPIANTLAYRPAHIYLIGTGYQVDKTDANGLIPDFDKHTQNNLIIAHMLAGDENLPETIPSSILAGSFWLLSASQQSTQLLSAWFRPDGQILPVVSAFRQRVMRKRNQVNQSKNIGLSPLPSSGSHLIAHYLLLPSYDWGIADWHLEVIRPFVKKYRPTIGFSVSEAAQAYRVTVIGDSHLIPDATVDELISAGCIVERITGDGILIATQLASK